jgi:hypothetical protein
LSEVKTEDVDTSSRVIFARVDADAPMTQTLTRHPCLIVYLSLVVVTFVANRLGLISWLAWLVRNEEDRHKEKRDSEDTDEYWRMHRSKAAPRSVDLFSQMILEAGLLIDDFWAILRLQVKKKKLPVDIGGNCDFSSPRKRPSRV